MSILIQNNILVHVFLLAPTDHDLMGLMMTRLANLEGRLQFQAKEIHEKVMVVSSAAKPGTHFLENNKII